MRKTSLNDNLDLKARLELTEPNDVPDDLELPIVREFLTDALHELDVVDETISLVHIIREILAQTLYDHALIDEIAIPSTPSGLSLLRGTRQARVAKFRAALAPHKKVPPEILSKIFLDACEDRPISLPPHSRTRPLAISQVCARWRQVALNEPRLWNNLSITTNRRLGDPFPVRMRDVFVRSAGMGIALTIDRRQYTGAPPEAATIIDIILPHLSLFRYLDLTFHTKYFSPIFYCSPGSIDSLESVRMNLDWPQWDIFDPFIGHKQTMTLFAGARSLRGVEIRSCHGYDRSYMLTWNVLDLPWAQLTFLHLGPGVVVALSLAHDILEHSPQLVDCMLHLTYGPGWNPIRPRDPVPGPIICPDLTSFSVFFRNRLITDEFMEPLVLPFLANLRSDHSDQPILISLIQRSTCCLTSLKLTPQHLLDNASEKLLEELPFLVELEAQSLIFPKPILERIARRQLVPRLEILYCHVKSPLSFVDMLERRAPGFDIDPGAVYPCSGFWVARSGCSSSVSRSMYATACHRLEKLDVVDGESLTLWMHSRTDSY
jgi:F-box-like